MPAVEVGGREVEVSVRVSSRARRARLVVDAQRNVSVVVPVRAPGSAVERLLAEHRGWLERQLAKPPLPLGLGLQREGCVWIGGRALPPPQGVELARWYREQARAEIVRLVEDGAARLGVSHGPVAIRDQRTRWGSCSPRGTLSFNWRLIMAPPRVLAYVVAHELCHLLRHDHAPAFWRLVEGLRPGYREDRRWLDEHGHELLAYRVPS